MLSKHRPFFRQTVNTRWASRGISSLMQSEDPELRLKRRSPFPAKRPDSKYREMLSPRRPAPFLRAVHFLLMGSVYLSAPILDAQVTAPATMSANPLINEGPPPFHYPPFD